MSIYMELGRFISIIEQEDSTKEEKEVARQAINEYLSRYIDGDKVLEKQEPCKYCNFFKDGADTFRGAAIIDDCDVETYLEKECGKNTIAYYLTSNSYYSGEASEEVEYCPKCGRKLAENNFTIDKDKIKGTVEIKL